MIVSVVCEYFIAGRSDIMPRREYCTANNLEQVKDAKKTVLTAG